jgi:hypothetical protein
VTQLVPDYQNKALESQLRHPRGFGCYSS